MYVLCLESGDEIQGPERNILNMFVLCAYIGVLYVGFYITVFLALESFGINKQRSLTNDVAAE